MRKVVTHSSMSSSQKIRAWLKEIGTVVSTKTIQRRLSLNSVSNQASQPKNHSLVRR